MSAGYAFVPLPDRVHRTSRAHAVLHRREPGTLAGRIALVFRTEQPVHIGTGRKRVHAGKVVRRGALVQGRPGIPGSSLKGVLRSRYEAVTRSCLGWADLSAHERRIRSSTGVTRARLVGAAVDPVAARGRCEVRRTGVHLCAACALFGRMSLRARVTVTDLVAPADLRFARKAIHAQFEPNLHHLGPCRLVSDGRGQIFEVHALHGRKHAVGLGPVPEDPPDQHLEVIPPGTLLAGELRLFNLLPEELGGLLVALGRLPASALEIGGGKGRDLGRMRLVHLEPHLVDPRGAAMPADQDGWRTSFEGSADRWPAGEQRLVDIHQGDC